MAFFEACAGGVIKDKGEDPKVRWCGLPRGQLPSPTWEALLSEPCLLAS